MLQTRKVVLKAYAAKFDSVIYNGIRKTIDWASCASRPVVMEEMNLIVNQLLLHSNPDPRMECLKAQEGTTWIRLQVPPCTLIKKTIVKKYEF